MEKKGQPMSVHIMEAAQGSLLKGDQNSAQARETGERKTGPKRCKRSVLALPSREEAKRGRFAYIGTFDFPAK